MKLHLQVRGNPVPVGPAHLYASFVSEDKLRGFISSQQRQLNLGPIPSKGWKETQRGASYFTRSLAFI